MTIFRVIVFRNLFPPPAILRLAVLEHVLHHPLTRDNSHKPVVPLSLTDHSFDQVALLLHPTDSIELVIKCLSRPICTFVVRYVFLNNSISVKRWVLKEVRNFEWTALVPNMADVRRGMKWRLGEDGLQISVALGTFGRILRGGAKLHDLLLLDQFFRLIFLSIFSYK